MRKRILASALAVTLALAFLPVAAAAPASDAVRAEAQSAVSRLTEHYKAMDAAALTSADRLGMLALGLPLDPLPPLSELGLTIPLAAPDPEAPEPEPYSEDPAEQARAMLALKLSDGFGPDLQEWRAYYALGEMQRPDGGFGDASATGVVMTALALCAPEGSMSLQQWHSDLLASVIAHAQAQTPKTPEEAAALISGLVALEAEVPEALLKTFLDVPLPGEDPTLTAQAAAALGGYAAGGSVYRRLAELRSAAELTFADRNDFQSWAAPYIAYCLDEGLLIGDDHRNFHPKQNVTRAQLAAALQRFLPTDSVPAPDTVYPDVTDAMWYFDEIWAVKHFELMEGRADGAFHPNVPATRREVAYAIAKLLELDASDPIQALADAGLWQGDGAGNFRPDDPVTRDELAKTLAMIHR
jgi:hypothetical protein